MSHGSHETAQSILKEYWNLVRLRDKAMEKARAKELGHVEDIEAH